MIKGLAYAKVNFGLRVGAVRQDGFHSLSGIFQSIDLSDEIAFGDSDEDAIATSGGGPVPDGMDNLAFRAAIAVRGHAGSTQPIRIALDKTIPTAAGLGGGSADAAATLAMAGRHFGVGMAALQEMAVELGSDVPFCLRGGSARVRGRGEQMEAIDELDGFALAVVVPPFELSTPAVFSRWDQMGDPAGLRMNVGSLPPSLRFEETLINDLYPAAVAIEPGLDDWRRELAESWGRPVMLSGSGPSLYAFFVDHEEANDALSAIPQGARAAEAADLSTAGWAITANDPG